jgi:CubicO group peptidase (beta-lactamase class C family)
MSRTSVTPRHVGWSVVLCLLVLAAPWSATGRAQDQATYPGASWERVAPEAVGWSPEKLKLARAYAATLDTAAVMVVVHGKVLDEWGETATKFNVHSIRKSFLSAMYGTPVRQGRIDLRATLAQRGIDDNEPSLSAAEKSATVLDLLKARSGIYHAALYETPAMKAARPARHSHAPGTFWYYNNWDFNAAGIIFERAVKNSIYREFQETIAAPIGMQDYTLDDGQYVTGPDSVYAAYPFRMTARDMARFGLLFLRQGAWRGVQVVPSDWVAESTASYSDTGQSGGYGYLWWVAVDGRHFPGVTMPAGSYSARGAHGHFILVVPAFDLVIVHRVNSDIRGREVSAAQFGTLVQLIFDARGGARGTGAGGRPVLW